MVLRAKALAKLRKTTHRHPQDDSKVRSKGCTHDTSCACTCKVCEAPTKGAQLGDFKDTVMCPRVGDARHYDVACVLGKCKLCGMTAIIPVDQVPRLLAAHSREKHPAVRHSLHLYTLRPACRPGGNG